MGGEIVPTFEEMCEDEDDDDGVLCGHGFTSQGVIEIDVRQRITHSINHHHLSVGTMY